MIYEMKPDEKSVAAVSEQLCSNIVRRGNRLGTGFLGTAILPHTLTKIGRADLAYTLLLQHENPSWLYSVDQGATTVWERWNSYTKKDGFGDVGMNSFNHYAYGSVAGWMFDSMAGISADITSPGFKHIILSPHPDARLSVAASYDSAYGVIDVKSAIDGGTWSYDFTIPANTSAEVHIPCDDVSDITVDGKCATELDASDLITVVGRRDGCTILSAVSGAYKIKAIPHNSNGAIAPSDFS